MTPENALKVAVIGATGYTGSHVCVELLSRGHHVAGICRNPGKLGNHSHYFARSVDVENTSIQELVDVFSGQDVVIKYSLFDAVLTLVVMDLAMAERNRHTVRTQPSVSDASALHGNNT
jgi:putative NADH-flavin reductase